MGLSVPSAPASPKKYFHPREIVDIIACPTVLMVVDSLMKNRAFCLGSWGSMDASELGTQAGEQNRVGEPQGWQWEEVPGSRVVGWLGEEQENGCYSVSWEY